jgi:hypothetical protein
LFFIQSFQTPFFSKYFDILAMAWFAFCISLSHKHPGKYSVNWWMWDLLSYVWKCMW